MTDQRKPDEVKKVQITDSQDVPRHPVRFVGGPKDGQTFMLPEGAEGRVEVTFYEPVPPKWFDDEWAWEERHEGSYEIEGDVARFVEPDEQ